jgi:outer membrane protein OmpA-like peptidoglycan-associated protein
MKKGQPSVLSAILAGAIGAAAAGTVAVDGIGLIQSAAAQGADDWRRQGRGREREQERQRAAPPRQEPPQRPAQQFQRQPAPERPPQQFQRQQQPERPAQQFQRQQQPERPAQQFQRQQQPERPTQQFQRQQQPERPTQQFQQPAKPAEGPPAEPKKKEGIQRFQPPAPGQQGTRPPPATFQNVPPAGGRPPSESGPERPTTVTPGGTPGPQPGQPRGQGFAPRRFDEMKRYRVERIEKGGARKVIQEPDRRFIVREHNRTIVRHDESERFLRRPGARSERRADGTVETSYVRRDGVRICTVVDGNGRLVRRFRRHRDGREHNIIDNRRFYRNVALGIGLGIIALNLPPPVVTIPDDEYIVDYDSASDDDLYETLSAPPIEDLDRPYSVEEIRDNYELRARVRSVDIDTIEFESGAWEVTPDQYDKLRRISRAILRVLEGSPEAVFMIAGHTDAVGSDEDNASLSDRRAGAVADVLTEQFEVPVENLVTQGYGEQYLKVDTQEPEPRNRRVSILNITGLMAER